RKETIERLFGTAKENHGFRYTQMYGKARMEMKVGLTFACMNLKKLAKIKAKWGLLEEGKPYKNLILSAIRLIKEKWLWDLYPRAALSTV
ncbi:MAG: transposase, partial [Muricoprocola sp.]